MKKVLSLFLVIVLLSSAVAGAVDTGLISPASNATLDHANVLKDLGLFLGTDKGFELDRAPTRAEAVVLLLRMLGEESAALDSTYENPFTDVPTWAVSYISYAYAKGYTKGTSATTFDAAKTVTPEQFITFMLRALGYKDNVDFVWNKSINKAEEIGLVEKDKYENGSAFLRGDCVDIIYSALTQTKKPQNVTLVKYLIKMKVVDAALAEKYGLYTTPQYETVRLPLTLNAVNKHRFISAQSILDYFRDSGAKYVLLQWTIFEFSDYEDVYGYNLSVTYYDFYNIVTKSANRTPEEQEWLDLLPEYSVYFEEDYFPYDLEGLYFVASVYDENANMIAASIEKVTDVRKNGHVEFAYVSVNGREFVDRKLAEFDDLFGTLTEYPSDAVYLEQVHVNWTLVDLYTDEIVGYMPYTDPNAPCLYRFVINAEKYPELANKTVFIADGELSPGESVHDLLREKCMDTFMWPFFFGQLSFGYRQGDFISIWEPWIVTEDWNQTRYVAFGDEDRFFGYAVITPSQRIVDNGLVIDDILYVY